MRLQKKKYIIPIINSPARGKTKEVGVPAFVIACQDKKEIPAIQNPGTIALFADGVLTNRYSELAPIKLIVPIIQMILHPNAKRF